MPQQNLQKNKSDQPDFWNVELADVIDVPALQEMMDDYYALTCIGVGIVDLKGRVLVGTGWQDICVKFHRAVPASCAFCHESDISLSMGVPPGTFKEYRCKNNMWDIATPIMLGDRHIGNIFLGQFLYDDENPDYELFRAQAKRFGYNEAEYLAALDRVPRWSRETVRRAMGFYSKLAGMISAANYNNVILADTLARHEQAEEELRESEAKFAKIFSAAPSLFAISTISEGRYIDVNASFEHLTGYRREEAIGRTSLELNLWTAETRARFLDAIGREMRVRDFEADFRSKDGKHMVVLVSAEVIELKGEECLLVLVKDITQRKQAENRLKESERLLAKAQEMSHLGSWSLDLLSNRLAWSDEIYRIFGLQQHEFAATYGTFLEAVHPEDRAVVNSAYTDSIQAGRDGYEIEHRIVRKDSGEIRHVYEKCEHIRDSSGRIIRSEGMVHDITERKLTEESLWLMKHVFYASITANSIAGLDGVITECNDAFLRIWRFERRDEVVGKPIGYFLNDTDEAAAIITTLNETGLWQGEFAAKRGDASTFIAYGMATQVRNKNGKVIGYQSACLDITERKQAEQELHQAKIAAEAANIAKSRFLATMSHEIRTPMNGVIGMIELLQHTELTPEQQEYSEDAKKSGIELVRLLNDILELSRIEADKLDLELSVFDLREVIAETVTLLSLSARENAVQLTSSIDSDVPVNLKGDAGRLRQLLINIVGNAIKFTPEGRVSLHIGKEQETESSTTLRFQVSDNGIGIPAGQMEHIFEPFTQADSSTTRRFGGTGLGLAICKRLTEMMGGSIGVKSVEGEGSTFWFTVVLEKPAADELVPPIAIPAASSNAKTGATGNAIPLLMAEDDSTAQLLVRTLLKHYGYEVNMAGNGKEALLALQNNDYALVLMDCMMPEMNGYEAATIIRDPASPVRRHDIPIIALTGNAMKEDRDRCIAAGMNDYISKPFVLKELLDKLEMWVKTQT